MTENRHFYSFINRCILHGRVFVMIFRKNFVLSVNITNAQFLLLKECENICNANLLPCFSHKKVTVNVSSSQ